jgi:signal transduction histidine kinase
MLLDGEGKVILANRAVGGLLNRDPSRLVGALCCDLMAQHRNTEAGCPVRNYPEGQAGSFEVFFPEYKFYEEKVFPIYRAGQQPLFVMQLRDLTSLHLAMQERRQFVKQLEETNRKLRRVEEEAERLRQQASRAEAAAMPGRLLALLLPEMFRTVRSLDEGLALLATEAGEGGGRGLDPVALLRELLASSSRSRAIVDKLSMLHLRDSAPAQVDVGALVAEVVEEARSEASEHGMELQLAVNPTGTVEGNAAQLKEVFRSLLWNSMEASKESRNPIKVSAGRLSDEVFVTVHDQGRGIPESQRDRLFTPFFTTDPEGRKVGLGLVICHHLLQAHGGAIDVDSIDGSGTLVRLRLPGAG